MPLISLMLVIAVTGLIAWLIVTFVPMPPKFGMLIYVVAGVAILFYLFRIVTGHGIDLRF